MFTRVQCLFPINDSYCFYIVYIRQLPITFLCSLRPDNSRLKNKTIWISIIQYRMLFINLFLMNVFKNYITYPSLATRLPCKYKIHTAWINQINNTRKDFLTFFCQITKFSDQLAVEIKKIINRNDRIAVIFITFFRYIFR